MGLEGAFGQIPFTQQVVPVLLGCRDYQVLVLALGYSNRKDDTDSLTWLHKTPKGVKYWLDIQKGSGWGC